MGPNGSGKSTRLRTPADALALTVREFSRRVALLTQGRPTPGGLTVRDIVEFGRHPYRGRWGRADPTQRPP